METEEKAVEVLAPNSLIEAQTRGEVDIQIATAKKYPRSIDLFKKEITSLATTDQETAEETFYVLPRAGKSIEGPSVRFAEMVASSWEHLRVQTSIVSIDDKFVTARGVAWDMQKNNAASCDVMRRITDKTGRKYNDDMVGTTANAAAAIARRNAVFAVVPKSYWVGAYEKAREVAIGNASTLVDRRARALEAFQKLGVPPQKVFEKFGVHGEEDITLEHLAELTGLRTAIKEGTTTIDEAFPKPEAVMPGKKSEKKDEGKKSGEAAQAGQQETQSADKTKGETEKAHDETQQKNEQIAGPKDRAGKPDKRDPLEKLRNFVLGPIETIRDTPHEVFLTMCKGLKGDEFNGLLMRYNDRKKEVEQ